MIAPTQALRHLALTTVLGDERLVVDRVSGQEGLGKMFEYVVTAFASDDDFEFDELLGTTAGLRLQQASEDGEDFRYFSGFVSRISHLGYNQHGLSTYELVLVPWLWFLTRTADCRIYQEKTVVEIIEDVFERHGFGDYRLVLQGDYPSRDYTVQYRESSFNFVQRLMEHEGIYYYWKHEEERHEMIICDAMSAHEENPGYESLIYRSKEAGPQEDEHLSSWRVTKQITPGRYTLNSFDFLAPTPSTNTRLMSRDSLQHGHAHGNYEVYDNPGDYQDREDGERYAALRREEVQANTLVVSAQSNARGLLCGSIFTPQELQREDQSDRPYLVTNLTFHAVGGRYDSGSGGAEEAFENGITAIPSEGLPFRPRTSVAKPFVKGPQTAIVTGPKGEEIHVDDNARIKVQFHWDRLGKYDDGTSCWIRVSQPWAGTTYGGLAIPRIGQEVIIDFLEGDPDRPVLTGRLYNGDSMPIVSNAGREESPARASRDKAKKKKEEKAKKKNEKQKENKKTTPSQ